MFLFFRDDPKKKTYHKDSHYKPLKSHHMSSHSKDKNRSRSRYRSYSKYEKKYPKQQMLPFHEEKLEQNASSQSQTVLFPAGNLPPIDNNSSNLLNMAYVMNQQLQSSQVFENKPEFVQFTHHNMNSANMTAPLPSNAQFNQESGMVVVEKTKKEELVFANNMANANNSNENNLESSYSHGK